MNLSEYSSEVVGFDSTWDEDRQVHVRDAGTETMENQVHVEDKNVETTTTKEIGVQASPTVASNSNEETDRKLALWLRKIMPALEKELAEGVTQVHENTNKSHSSFAQLTEYQQIDVKSYFPQDTEEDLISGTGIWMSIQIQNNPVLVLSCYLKASLDQPKASFLIVYEPQRSKSDGNIYWQEVTKIPMKDQLDFLVVNPDNRDMFAAASSSGDLYVWSYVKSSSSSSSNETRVVEIFSKTSEDSIVGLTFLSDNIILCCLTDGSIISYKIINKQNCIVDKVIKIDQKRVNESQITSITGINKSSTDFIIGFSNGKIFYCATSQFSSQDAIVRELSAHKFSVKLLKHCQHNAKNYIVSIDISSEIFVHDIDEDPNEKSLKFVVRLPLPIKNSIALTNNMEHIFCPLLNGSLEIFNVKKNSRRIIDGNLSGNNILAELSKNESWLIVGIFNGVFKIFNVCVDNE